MLVGDVAGKGMPASLLMSSLQARVKVLFEDGDRLAEKITRLNKATTAHTPDNRFITFFMTVADPATGELVFTNAGHNPPVLVRAKGGFELLAGHGAGTWPSVMSRSPANARMLVSIWGGICSSASAPSAPAAIRSARPAVSTSSAAKCRST
jgi:hypothetical protein